MGFPVGPVVKNPPTDSGDTDLIPGSGRSPGVGNDNLLQYSCLGNAMDRGSWQATVHRVTESRPQLSTHACITDGQYCVSFRCIAKSSSLSLY